MYLNRNNGTIVHHQAFADIIDYLKPDDVLVLNSSKVIPARLFGKKDTGASVETLLLRNISGNDWECLVRPGNKLKVGAKAIFSEELSGEIIEHLEGGLRIVRFEYVGDLWSILDRIGTMPLPPYIKRETIPSDNNNYQTIYADQLGSAAAPTAGLHFSEELLSRIELMGTTIVKIVLHIGLDTFKPMSVDNILDHKMHSELCSITPDTANTINQAKLEKRRIIAVGTTTTRALESFAIENSESNNPQYLLEPGSKWSDIFIYPGYNFKVTDGMITNFHLPESTLLMMISAFAGYDNIREAYQQAVVQQYRFFSYGDAMVIL
jgi:S-adenosylmethionine:tRNA ribosyltransferase-isomerase